MKKFTAAIFLPCFPRFFYKEYKFTFSPRRDKIKINKIKIHQA